MRAKSFFQDKSSLRLGEDILDSKQETFLTKQIFLVVSLSQNSLFRFFIRLNDKQKSINVFFQSWRKISIQISF